MAESRELKVVSPATGAAERICLIVAGMHRSGTSALTRALNILGADVPSHVLGAEDHNEAGHWEPERIVAIHDDMLSRTDSRWDDWRALSVQDLSARDRKLYQSTLARLIAEEYGASKLFVLKDPRVCRFIPMYEQLLLSMRIEPRFLLPFRNPLEVAASLDARDGISAGYASLVWLRHILDAEQATRGRIRTVSRYEDLMLDHSGELSRIGRDLSIAWPVPVTKAKAELELHFQKRLKHHETTDAELFAATDIPAWVKDAYECMSLLRSDPHSAPVQARLDVIREEFDAACTRLGEPAFVEFIRREADWQSDKTAFKQQIEALRGFLQRMDTIADRQADANDSSGLEAAALSVRFSRIETEARDLNAQLSQTTRQLDIQRAEAEVLAENLHAARDQSASLSAQLAISERELSAVREVAALWEQRIIDMHRQQTANLQAITSSTSWKLTRPLRGVKRLATEAAFRKALAKSVARRVFAALPLSGGQKRKLYDRYAQMRQARSHKAAMGNLPGPALTTAPAGAMPEASLLALPPDGRWHPDQYAANQSRLGAFLSALRTPDEDGPLALASTEIAPAPRGPLISVIVRTYGNRKALLSRALDSIRTQTYRPIEVLVIDDGGETQASIIDDFNTDPDCVFRLIRNPKLGRSAAANTGLDAAAGELVGFLDDDDYLLADHLARLAALAMAEPQLDAVHAASRELAADVDPATGMHGAETLNAVFLKPVAHSAELFDRNPFPIQSLLFRKNILRPQDRFDRNLDALEDWLFWMRLLCGRCIGGIADVTSVFYVPLSDTANSNRINAHLAAEPYFQTQRRALFEERRLTSLSLVNTRIQDIYQRAQTRSALAPAARLPEPRLRPAGSERLFSTLSPSQIDLGFDANRGKVVAFTSINLRYLPKALAWAKSVKDHNPDWETHILLNDALPADTASWPCVDRVFPVSALSMPGVQSWAFGMRVVEFCTATKPFYARRLLDAGYAHVFFFDPDTFVYSDLTQLLEAFGDHEVLVTPHCSQDAMLDAEIHYNEISSLAHGIFNLGFLGLKNGPNAGKVIDFWCRRLSRHCVDDHARGLFTDQKWFNFVPVFFDRVKILKHKGCNTASWNIASRPITSQDGRLMAGGEPLIFFHFSGYDKNVPRTLFDIFGRFDPALEAMIGDYDRLNDHYASKFPDWRQEWSLARYDNGEPIQDAHREIYRSHYQYQLVFDSPFETGPRSFRAELNRMGPDGLAELLAPDGYMKRFY